jgi:hypothetical protein
LLALLLLNFVLNIKAEYWQALKKFFSVDHVNLFDQEGEKKVQMKIEIHIASFWNNIIITNSMAKWFLGGS